jgi:hypothetical protein
MADADRRHGAEAQRLLEDARHEKNWKRWGPYLSERQWGTVREDYSEGGACWEYFPHDHARSRAYRWGEDGLLGICDREGRLCFALALWNGKDPILKERLFGLTGPEGNHGEDVKECYYYLDATPTASYLKALYKYPQAAYPYARLVGENRHRGKLEAEFELADTGIFEGNRYFDVQTEYAKAAADDLLIRITISNRGPDAAAIRLLPTLWFRNTWSWGRTGEGYWPRPRLALEADGTVLAEHASLGRFRLAAERAPERWLFTDNESNAERLWKLPNGHPHVKDAFHEFVVAGRAEAVNPQGTGTKAAALYAFEISPGASVSVRLRLTAEESRPSAPFADFERTFSTRVFQADEFYQSALPAKLPTGDRQVTRQAYAGLLWSKQFYTYVVKDWLEGDPGSPTPPSRRSGRNSDWPHFYARDVLSMPDKWEYPWFAAWDLAFHTVAFAKIDPDFAKEQLLLLLREWYSHPNGQLPAYEFAFGDVNPPVHPWACWRVYKMTGPRGKRDRLFLERTFQKLLFNFGWWVNRKDADNNHLFSGGFLGLDNIGVFDRSKPLPSGCQLEQADGTAWMAFASATMLSMALELAREDPAYEDVASKFFEHFIAIADAENTLGGTGLWNEEDGFYYDQIRGGDSTVPLRIRSMVGIIPLFAVEVLDQGVIDRLPGFSKRLKWFLENRKDLADHISWMTPGAREGSRLLAIPSRERLLRVLRYVLDEREFLSPYGIRSLSRIHMEKPFVFPMGGQDLRVDYVPGESTTGMFGGNSNWRGPVWFPVNYLLIEALERYHHFYGDTLRVECPTGSGRLMTLHEVALELEKRLTRVFLPDASGRRPVHGGDARYADDPYWRDLVLFYEYFHGETGRGIGASHQTGWTAVVARWLEDLARERSGP